MMCGLMGWWVCGRVGAWGVNCFPLLYIQTPDQRISGRYVTIACHQQSQITSLHQRSLIAHANRCRFEADPPTL